MTTGMVDRDIETGAAYGWVIVAITFLSMALVLGSRFCLGLFLPYLPDALDASPASVSGAIAISMLAAAALQPVAGILLDRFGGKLVLAVGLGFAGLALCGTSFAGSLWQLTLAMGLVSSVGYAFVSPVSVTTIVSRWFDRKRGTAMGIATSGTKVAMIVLPPAIAALIVHFGWRTAMLAVGLAIMLLIPAVLLLVRPAPQAETKPVVPRKEAAAADAASTDATLARALRHPAFWLIVILLFANGLMMNLVFVHLPSYVLALGYDQTLAATGLTLIGGVGILGTIITGAISDRLGRRSVLLLMFGARGVTTLFVLLAPGLPSFAAFLLVFGLLGYGAIGVIGALVSEIFGRRAIGAILGSAYVFNQVGAATGVYAGGASLAWTGSFSAALWLAVATTFIAAACVLFLREKAAD